MKWLFPVAWSDGSAIQSSGAELKSIDAEPAGFRLLDDHEVAALGLELVSKMALQVDPRLGRRGARWAVRHPELPRALEGHSGQLLALLALVASELEVRAFGITQVWATGELVEGADETLRALPVGSTGSEVRFLNAKLDAFRASNYPALFIATNEDIDALDLVQAHRNRESLGSK